MKIRIMEKIENQLKGKEAVISSEYGPLYQESDVIELMKGFAKKEVDRVVPLHKSFVAENIKLTEQNRTLYEKLMAAYKELSDLKAQTV